MNQIPADAQFQFVPSVSERAETAVGPVSQIVNDAGRHSLLLRFMALNMAAIALVSAAWGQGWLQLIVEADNTGLTFVIAAVFVVGFAFSFMRVVWLDRELGCLDHPGAAPASLSADYLAQASRQDASARQIIAAAAKLKIGAELSIVRQFANSLVLLGLIGTVVGFIIALSGVDATSAGDVSAITPMVARLLSGMSVALYTTLVGAALNLWLSVNHNLLSRAGAKLYARMIELGEAHAGARTP